MNRLNQNELNPQQASHNRLSPAARGLLPESRVAEGKLQPNMQRMFSGAIGFSIRLHGLVRHANDVDVSGDFQNWNSVREIVPLEAVDLGGDVLGKLFSRSTDLPREQHEWTEERQRDLDALIQKEALGAISDPETIELERLLVIRDQTALGPKLIHAMNEEQQALTQLVNAFEHYVRTTRSH